MGFLAGGVAVGGAKPNTSSMYTSARKLVLPGCVCIQVASFDSSSETTNCCSRLERCARYTIAARGFLSLVHSNCSKSIACPCIHGEKDGVARSAFIRIANSFRSLRGKNDSISNTPSLRIGGDWICLMSSAKSRLMPCAQDRSIRFASKMCSWLLSGSTSIPISPNIPDTRLATSARLDSRLSCQSVGAESEPRALRGIPVVDPGV